VTGGSLTLAGRTGFHGVAVWLWGFMALALPFSTALTLIFSTLATIFSVPIVFRKDLVTVWQSKIAILCIVLFLWLSFSAFWGVAPPDEALEGISKYRKLLFLALIGLSVAASSEAPLLLLRFFFVGCLITTLGSIMIRFGIFEWLWGPPNHQGGWAFWRDVNKHMFFIGGPSNPTFGRNHITQGAFGVFGGCFAAGWAWKILRKPKPQISIGITLIFLTFFFMVSIFSMQGRSGYLLAVCGSVIFNVICILKLNGWKRYLPGTLTILGFLFLAFTSPQFLPRTEAALNETFEAIHDGSREGQGVRIRFWEAGLNLSAARPITGYGVGGYAQAYSELSDEPLHLRESRAQPHSEYVILLVQGGLPAVLLYFGILFLLIRASYRYFLRVDDPSLLAVIILFALYSAFNSSIWDLAEGHFFSLIGGVLLAGALKPMFDSPNSKKTN